VTRLPQIHQNKRKEEELKAQMREEKQKKKQEAQRRIDEQTEKLRRQFTEASKLNEQKQIGDRSRSFAEKKFEINRTVVTPRKQASIERMKIAKSGKYHKQNTATPIRDISYNHLDKKRQQLELIEQKRLSLDKRSATVEKSKQKANTTQGSPQKDRKPERAERAEKNRGERSEKREKSKR
jgi:hypothetical protein